ncbi:MAG: arsenate reductase ArsC [Planctomycetes bacterium]|nr:arsenate reductase ArsC [Planctomycetota bacterium]
MKAAPPLRVLFVCVENSNRSQMAEAFARIHGGARVEALSAGSRPAGAVNPRAIAAMHAKGYDLARQRSKSIAEVGPGPVDAVVTMGCGDACPNIAARVREDWSIPDPRHMDEAAFALVRDRIEREVIALLARLGLPSS